MKLEIFTSLMLANSIIIIFAALFFTYYSLRSMKFKKEPLTRQIMVAGILIFLVAGILDHYYLWMHGVRKLGGWLLFIIESFGIIIIAFGSLSTWKKVQKLYNIPLRDLARQISDIRHHLAGISILLLSIPLDIIGSVVEIPYFSGLNVIVYTLLAVGLLILAINARIEYSSMEKIEKPPHDFDPNYLKRGKLSTLREDIALTYAFTYLMNSYLAKITPMLGSQVIQNTLKSWEEEHPLLFQNLQKGNNCEISEADLINNLDRVYNKERLALIKKEFSSLLSYFLELIGKIINYRTANKILSDSYEKLERYYENHPIVGKILRIIPSGYLENKKLALLTKEELEKKVRARTKELEKSNEQLIAEIEERKKVENKLKKSLQEKDILLREIHHRVKNNLQIISSLLNLQSKKIKDRDARAAFQQSCDRIRTMAAIHNQLYRYENLAQIKFSKYVKDLTNYLFRSYSILSDHIKLNLEIDENIFLEIDKAIPCGLIINELVTNALKYAFPDQKEGHIEIEMNMKNDKDVALVISDNGQGLPADFSFDNTDTLGVRLVNRLVDQLDGDFKYYNSNGTQFFITFPNK
ncbi:MAG: ATP-binding protein [Candidatus Marinimicrobia bacterium]|nr:ATP-binding protein [Candidatus Neomarinimicrobiota bacterium]